MYLLLSRIGVVSAVPIQLMSDHIFLGASVVAILSAELVLLRVNLRSRREPLAAHILSVAGIASHFAQNSSSDVFGLLEYQA